MFGPRAGSRLTRPSRPLIAGSAPLQWRSWTVLSAKDAPLEWRAPGKDLTQLDPGGGVVAGAFAAAFLAIDAAFLQSRAERGRQQKVIDAQAGIALPAPPLVVPEGVHRLVGEQGSERIGPALGDQLGIGRASLRLHQRVVLPGVHGVDVEVG